MTIFSDFRFPEVESVYSTSSDCTRQGSFHWISVSQVVMMDSVKEGSVLPLGNSAGAQSAFKISQITLELLSDLIGPDAELMTAVKATIDNLAKSAEGVTLFGSNSASEKHGNFQIMACTVDEFNQVNAAFVGAYFTVSQVSKNYFFDTYSREGIQLFKVAHVFTFIQDVYACVRESVIKKPKDKVDIDRIRKFIDV